MTLMPTILKCQTNLKYNMLRLSGDGRRDLEAEIKSRLENALGMAEVKKR